MPSLSITNCEKDAVGTAKLTKTATWLKEERKLYQNLFDHKHGKRRSYMSWRLWTKRHTVFHRATACERELIESLRW